MKAMVRELTVTAATRPRVTLTPGTYALACFMDDDTDGKSRIAHGMLKQFAVR
jgi:uncharacterized protein (DUF2141 family)